VANVLGVVLLVATVLTAVTVLAGASATTMTDRTEAIAGETARADLGTLAAETTALAPGGQARQRVPLSGTVDAYSVTDDGRLTVELGSPGSWRTVTDTSLGAVVADTGSGTVALQGGGVWRVRANDPESATALRAPPLSVVERADTTLTIPVYRVGGAYSVTGAAEVTLADQRPVYRPLYVPDDEAVRITVRSRFAHAWADVFERAVADNATVDVDDERVRVTLPATPGRDRYLHGAVHRIEIDEP
jgi:hypothetical protein